MQRIQSVGILSVAKMMAIVQGCIGLIFVPFALLGGLASFATGEAKSAIGGAVFLAFGILAPFFYAAFGFIFGALGAWLYNLVARKIGGIEIELMAIPPLGPIVPQGGTPISMD
jgi:hypothetical protein